MVVGVVAATPPRASAFAGISVDTSCGHLIRGASSRRLDRGI
jgi:hypothetical protein